MSRIPSIETRYMNIVFRSRLEARWGVFFDCLKLDWYYEHEGFDLGRFGRYLPDFYFPQGDFFAEIKPPRPSMNELKKPIAFAKLAKKKVLVVCGHMPKLGAYDIAALDGRTGVHEHFTHFCDCRKCDGVWMERGDGEAAASLICRCDPERTKYPTFGDRMTAAHMTATLAQFDWKDKAKL